MSEKYYILELAMSSTYDAPPSVEIATPLPPKAPAIPYEFLPNPSTLCPCPPPPEEASKVIPSVVCCAPNNPFTTADVGEMEPASNSKKAAPAGFSLLNVEPPSVVFRISAPAPLEPAATKAVVAELAPTPVAALATSPGDDQVAAEAVAASVAASVNTFIFFRVFRHD
jgi:hypothetical protein